MQPATKRFLAVVVSIIAVFACLASFAFSNRPAAITAPSVPYRVDTANGVIVVPGTAFIEAFDPATNSNIEAINVWRETGHAGQSPVCQLVDGNRLTVNDSADAAGSLWFHVTSGSCSGWVLSEFVRATRQ